ncbi:hypothetical protein [Pseudoruegeria sp. HB172150]|uniref:hypothetical protein n=1 Tax=Pseudoruegeria sp. HB172150 TaxID=2721164 RepID=UPI001555E755|nr:hypothetical protein [Pseudoruegeria sp. HB172150]
MADTNYDRDHVRETHIRERSGGNSVLAFIVGGLLVAVAAIAYLVYGADFDQAAPAGDGGNVEINVDSNASGAAGGEAAADSDSTEAPADGGASADAEATVAPSE